MRAALSKPETAAAEEVVSGANGALCSPGDAVKEPSCSPQGSLQPAGHKGNAMRVACRVGRSWQRLATKTPGSCRRRSFAPPPTKQKPLLPPGKEKGGTHCLDLPADWSAKPPDAGSLSI